MLCKLSFKNIKKSLKDYAIYFFTLVLGISIFYLFNSIDSQTAMMNLSESTSSIIELMTRMMSVVSVFVSFILGFLVIYASRFLIKRRNKEFAIYLTLGMSKRKISLILFFETLIIGFVSLGVGLLFGVILSQLMSVLVASMFEVDLTSFKFVFSSSAFIKTIIYFGIIYLIVMLFNTIIINKCKLIDLINSNVKKEKLKLKSPVLSFLLFIVAVIILGYAYYLVITIFDRNLNDLNIFLPIILGIVGTFLVFFSLSGFLIKILNKKKKLYYKELNSFVIRGIGSKINTTVVSVTVICLMLFSTICILASALSIRNSLNNSLIKYAPYDIEISKTYNAPKELYGYTDSQAKDSFLTINESFDNINFNYKKYFTDVIDFTIYSDDSITLQSSLGSYYKIAKKKYPYLGYASNVELMKVSDYNKIAKAFKLDSLALDDNHYALVANYKSMKELKEEGLKKRTVITISNNDYYPKYSYAIDGFYEMASNGTNLGFLVLPDEALDNASPYKYFKLANYKEDKEKTEKMINNLMKTDSFSNTILSFNTKEDIYASSIGIGALVTFIGLYLGIIFLISCAAILALKELSESSDNKMRYNILRKIGASEEMVNKALFKQIGIFFLLPLSLAVIHSVFGIMFCNKILVLVGVNVKISSIIITALFIVLIYESYFLLTYYCSKNIIKDKN